MKYEKGAEALESSGEAFIELLKQQKTKREQMM